ncbi:MAG: protein translocase subunit SecD [Candidatus Omnitrophica bacterium]|nr:protein translocase subunit SecD [Candidatus Omnitrophota bacterium]
MIKRNDLNLRVVIILTLAVLSIFSIFPFTEKINLGLDLKGGMYILLRADTTNLPKDKVPSAISAAVEKIRNRIDNFGVKETSISLQGTDYILVQIPGIIDRELVKKLKEVGKLEFKLVEDDKMKNSLALKGESVEGYTLMDFKDTKLLLHNEPSLVGADLAESYVGFDAIGMPSVKLQLTPEGAKKFAKVTEENVGKLLAIVLDGKVMSAPQIKEAITSGQAEITGDFSLDEARLLTAVLNSGALPIPLIVEEERSVGPTLGSDSIRRGINATILGLIFVVIFMLFYYFLGGVVAFVCLALDILFILATLHFLKGTLTLPGVAGIILTLGMAVDANVLIYERIREELSEKKPLSLAIKNGFEYSKRAIYDANITTIIAATFLFYFGTGPVRGFATTLILGNIVSIFTAIYVGKTIFSILLNLKLNRFPMLTLLKEKRIDFIKYGNFCFILSLLIIIFGMINFYSKKNVIFGTDFVGGQILEYKLTHPVSIEKIRSVLKDAKLDKINIQEFKDIEGAIIIKSKDDVTDKVEKVLTENFKGIERLNVTTVGPTVGRELRNKAIFAIVFSLLGILVYIASRFKHWDFALAGVVALLHDILISLGFVSIFGYQIDLLIVTALLTIAGYSINDTIVIYDRIREIFPKLTRFTFKDIINKALNQTLSRTVITSITTIMVATIIYLFGGEALKGFSFCLLVGFISGVYSTIYIASFIVLLLRKK